MSKVVIITGSEGDIGKALVKKFKKESYIVYGWDLKTGVNITKGYSVGKALTSIVKKHTKIDVLVNNAGVTSGLWNNIQEINLQAPYNLSTVISDYMPKGSSIVNITSLWSEFGFKNNPAYGASKGGLKSLTKCLAADLAPNIRVNSVGFGYIQTKMTEYSWKNRRKLIEDKTLLKRWGKPEDVVGLIYFLCTNEASYITGQNFMIDGGWTAWGGF